MRDLVINGNAVDLAAFARQQDSGKRYILYTIPRDYPLFRLLSSTLFFPSYVTRTRR
jgi:hypothetical protein